ncbi:DUF1868 domain-containing protein [Streptococcus halichoeri]
MEIRWTDLKVKELADEIQKALKNLAFSEKLTVLPFNSLHITLFTLI